MKIRRRFYQARNIVWRWWWIASGEKQRILDEHAHFRRWGTEQFNRARAADHAVYMLKVEHRGASVDVLRAVADRIDCEPGCEENSYDPSTGVTECRLVDRGECPFDDACQLRDLAAALETHAATTWRPNPSPTAERKTTMETLSQTEARCAAGATAPRVTLADLEANIAFETSFLASDAVAGMRPNLAGPASLDVLTICLIVTRNGFTIIGKAAPAVAANFDPVKGAANAREDALRQLWPLMGYALRERHDALPVAVVPPRPDMPQYLGTKLVNARPITRQDYLDLRDWNLPENEDGADAGYLVEYTDRQDGNVDGFDGYVTWSPAAVFEAAYRRTGA